MMERPAQSSFIVRIYRVDLEDHRKLTGLVEVVDSGKRVSFNDIDELGAILNRTALAGGKKERGPV